MLYRKPALIMPRRRPIFSKRSLFIVTATASNNGSGTGASPTVSLPAGLSNDLLLVVIQCAGNNTWTWPAGWTELWDNNRLSGGYKVSDGTETTVAPTQNGTSRTAWGIWRVRNQAASSFIEVASATTTSGSSAAPDPPSITPSWGTTQTLIIAVGTALFDANFTTFPSGYVNETLSKAIPDPNFGFATKMLTPGATENPGAFGLDASGEWRAQTIAIKSA